MLYNKNQAHQRVDDAIARIASRQHGVFTYAQAQACGATEAIIRWRVENGRWKRPYPRVYYMAGTGNAWLPRLLAACFFLGPNAVASHRTAAALRRMRGFARARLEFTLTRNRNPTAHDIVVHRTRQPIPEEDITIVDGIRVTKPARTLLDLASVEPEPVVARCLDDALRRRLVSLTFLDTWLQDLRRRRHRGSAMLRRLTDERMATGFTESPLEAQLLTLLRDAGLPLPMLQYDIRHGDRFIARVDFAYPQQMIVIEADGFLHHDLRATFDGERARGNEIEALGWRILRITSRHIEETPDKVIDWVRRALNRSG